MKVRVDPFPTGRRGEHASQSLESREVVPPHATPAHPGIELDVERPVGSSHPRVERRRITDRGPEIVSEISLHVSRMQRTGHEQWAFDPALAERAPLFDGCDAEAPGIYRQESASDLDCTETVTVSFDHRQQSATGDGGDSAGIRGQRGEVDIDPGAGRLGSEGRGQGGGYLMWREA